MTKAVFEQNIANFVIFTIISCTNFSISNVHNCRYNEKSIFKEEFPFSIYSESTKRALNHYSILIFNAQVLEISPRLFLRFIHSIYSIVSTRSSLKNEWEQKRVQQIEIGSFHFIEGMVFFHLWRKYFPKNSSLLKHCLYGVFEPIFFKKEFSPIIIIIICL